MASINQQLDQSVFVRIAEEIFKWDFKKRSKRAYIMTIVDFFFNAEQKKDFNKMMNDFEIKWIKPFDWWEKQIGHVNKGVQKPMNYITIKINHRGYTIREKKIINYEELQNDMREIISKVRHQLKVSLSRQNIDFANYTKQDLKNAISIK